MWQAPGLFFKQWDVSDYLCVLEKYTPSSKPTFYFPRGAHMEWSGCEHRGAAVMKHPTPVASAFVPGVQSS